VNSVDWCSTIKLGGPESLEFVPGKPFIGSSNAFGDGDTKKTGWLTAVDADTGKVLWKYHDPSPLVAGLLPTASGLVFTGDLAGNLLAFDGATGKILFKDQAGGPVGGGVIAYSLGGQEYIAVAAGMQNWIMQTKSGPATIAIYALHQ
jgi:alcohol dehydrogenase (cytochrome c)